MRQPLYKDRSAAFANGFNDSAYFSKVFRRVKGMTPREFKQRGE